jgi:hypothetical protein
MLEDWDASGSYSAEGSPRDSGGARSSGLARRKPKKGSNELDSGDPASAYIHSRETGIANWNFGGKDEASTLMRRRFTPLNASYPLPDWQVVADPA